VEVGEGEVSGSSAANSRAVAVSSRLPSISVSLMTIRMSMLVDSFVLAGGDPRGDAGADVAVAGVEAGAGWVP
jgi:hypothetical protein